MDFAKLQLTIRNPLSPQPGAPCTFLPSLRIPSFLSRAIHLLQALQKNCFVSVSILIYLLRFKFLVVISLAYGEARLGHLGFLTGGCGRENSGGIWICSICFLKATTKFPVFETVGPEEALSKSDDNFWMEFLRAKGLRSRDGIKEVQFTLLLNCGGEALKRTGRAPPHDQSQCLSCHEGSRSQQKMDF